MRLKCSICLQTIVKSDDVYVCSFKFFSGSIHITVGFGCDESDPNQLTTFVNTTR